MRFIKKSLFGVFLFLIIVSLGATSAAGSCQVTDRSSCNPDNTVLGLSDVSNAHGETYDESNYAKVVCCDFAGSHSCDGSNKIVGLSSITNAHAEIPSLSNYGTNVCFGNLVCRSTNSDCDADETLMLSLTSETNAHLSNSSISAVKICCRSSTIPSAYWADTNQDYIEEAFVAIGTTKILLILKNSGLPEGTSVDFSIYEYDTWPLDGYIRTITGTVNAEGNAIATWTVTQEDIDTASASPLEGALENFYFKANGKVSNDLNITLIEESYCPSIGICADYQTQGNCEVDLCGVAEASLPDIDCSQRDIDCQCSWVVNESGPDKCAPTYTIRSQDGATAEGAEEGFTVPSRIGTCTYNEDTESDDCEDGLLTYSWKAIWEWDPANVFQTNPDGDDFVNDETGWHYDPFNPDGSRASEKCVDGSNVIPCPARIKIPFFNIYNLIATILFIVLIYLILRKNKIIPPLYKKKKKKKK